MGNFNPYKYKGEVGEVFLRRLNESYRRRPVSDADYIDAANRAAEVLKKILYSTRKSNQVSVARALNKVRRDRDPMVDAVELDDDGEVSRIWSCCHRVPKYRDFIDYIMREGKIPNLFPADQDAQIFFLEDQTDEVKAEVNCAMSFGYGSFAKSEYDESGQPINTAYISFEDEAKLRNGNFLAIDMVFTEGGEARIPLGVIKRRPLSQPVIIGDLKSNPKIKGTEADIEGAIKLQTEDADHEEGIVRKFLVGTFGAALYQYPDCDPFPKKPPIIFCKRIDRFNP